MYCLYKSDTGLTAGNPNITNSGNPDTAPLITFNDVDKDGMIDMAFYQDKKIWVYYNMHEPESVDDYLNQKLCKSQT